MLSQLLIWIAAITCGTTCLHAYEWDLSKIELEAGYTSGRFISIKDDYAEIGLFAPVGIDHTWEPFVDATGYCFKDGKWAASAGLGLRGAATSYKAWGINAFYDYLRGENKKDFHRAGFGAEWLTECYDLRINAYIPFCCRTQHVDTRVYTESNFFVVVNRFQYAYTGFDAEIGRRLFVNSALSLYLAGGPYYYTKKHFDNFWGGFVWAEVNWRSLVSLQARASYDHAYSINAQAAILITLPLDLLSCFACECSTPMSQRVRRTGIVLTGKDCCCWNNW
jgi:hypothetical protein